MSYVTEKLQVIVSSMNANWNHQVLQEMAITFACMCQQIDNTQRHPEKEIPRFSKEIDPLEELESELENFTKQFLRSSNRQES